MPATIDFIHSEKRDSNKIILFGYSQGTTVSTYALATNSDFFADKVKLFVALAPAVLFKNSNEPSFKALSSQQWIMDLLLQFDYLEFEGKNRDVDSDFVAYLKASNPFFCYAYNDICNFGKINE